MTMTSVWFIAALVVFGCELMLGTVYLLAAGAGLAAGGAVAWLGLDLTWQFAAIALVTVCGCLLARRIRLRRGESEDLQAIDVGRRVQVKDVRTDGTALVLYRGARWRARAESGSLQTGEWIIRRVDGTELVLGPAISKEGGN